MSSNLVLNLLEDRSGLVWIGTQNGGVSRFSRHKHRFKHYRRPPTAPSKNRYAYKLENFDDGWIESGARRYATYTNLDGGTYTFRVRGSNSDGVWSDEEASIEVVIVPPPWKTGGRRRADQPPGDAEHPEARELRRSPGPATARGPSRSCPAATCPTWCCSTS